jgi:hypothetical protein
MTAENYCIFSMKLVSFCFIFAFKLSTLGMPSLFISNFQQTNFPVHCSFYIELSLMNKNTTVCPSQTRSKNISCCSAHSFTVMGISLLSFQSPFLQGYNQGKGIQKTFSTHMFRHNLLRKCRPFHLASPPLSCWL